MKMFSKTYAIRALCLCALFNRSGVRLRAGQAQRPAGLSQAQSLLMLKGQAQVHALRPA
jgi:hypothetical protein